MVETQNGVTNGQPFPTRYTKRATRCITRISPSRFSSSMLPTIRFSNGYDGETEVIIDLEFDGAKIPLLRGEKLAGE